MVTLLISHTTDDGTLHSPTIDVDTLNLHTTDGDSLNSPTTDDETVNLHTTDGETFKMHIWIMVTH